MTVSAPGGERSSIASMLAVVVSARHDPAARILNVNLLAALLPWSTSGVAIVARAVGKSRWKPASSGQP